MPRPSVPAACSTLVLGFVLLLSAPRAAAQPAANSHPPQKPPSSSPAQAAPAAPAAPAPPAPPRQPFRQDIPSAAFAIEMKPIPASADGSIKPVWISATEITWEAYDVYAYRLDEPDDAPYDAASRPTKPYLPPDRGFGHEGYAAISTTHKSVTKFCEWLSAKSGKKYRLPTEDEWEHACRAGAAASSPFFFGDDPARLPDFAWFKANADGTPHPVAKKQPNAWGLFDMHGNVREWVNGRDGKPTTKGGCYLDDPPALHISARASQDRTWNQTDPQIPKSTWWLSDGPFAGFRIVCEADPADPAKPARSDAPPAPADRPGDAKPPPASPKDAK